MQCEEEVGSHDGLLKTNEWQTGVGELSTLSSYVLTSLMEAISSVVFINRLIDPNIKKASDLPRDEYGKIKIVIEEPHKLEDMNYFREAGLRYLETGKYCPYKYNPRPDSDYYKFWKIEKDRIINGMVRESDGEWITGDLYFYWNYCNMTVNESNGILSERVSDKLPSPYYGDYMFFHYLYQARVDGENAECLKKRACGWSYKLGSIGIRNAVFYKKHHSFYLATITDYLYKDGVVTKAWDVLDHITKHTEFTKTRILNTQTEKKIGYKDPKTGIESGSQSTVMGISLHDSHEKHRGKRGLTMFEEYGNFANLEPAWNIGVDNVKMGKSTIAQLIGGGTGGTNGASFESAQKMFYNPRGFKIKALKNIYEQTDSETTECGFFWPTYLNLEGFNDKDGNPDVIGALIYTLKEREVYKNSGTDNLAFMQRRAEQPIYPSEAMLRGEDSIFPVIETQEYLSDIMKHEKDFISKHTVASLYYEKDNTVWYKPEFTKQPIRKYPLLGNAPEGCVELFYPPLKDYPSGLNIIGVDPIDEDYNPNGSLASVFVFSLMEDKILAEYTGRPKFADEFFELTLKLSMLYNADVMYENNKKRMFDYYDRRNALHRLMDTPEFMSHIVKFSIKKGIGNRSKGYYNHGDMKEQLTFWCNEFLREVHPSRESMNLYEVRSLGLLRELVSFNPKGNYDRISALGAVMLARQSRKKFLERMQTASNSKLKELYNSPSVIRLMGGANTYNIMK